jgi:hypothetical protein
VSRFLRRVSLPVLTVAVASCWLTASFENLSGSGGPDASPDVAPHADGGGDAGGDSQGHPTDGRAEAEAADAGADTSSFDASCTSSTTYVESVMAAKPIAYWRLGDATESTLAKDETGNYPGTYSSDGVTWGEMPIPGVDGGASVLLNGMSGDIVVTANHFSSKTSEFAPKQPFTLEVWVQPIAVNSSFLGILSNELMVDGGKQGYAMYVQEDAGFGFDRYQSPKSTPLMTPDSPVKTTQWYHLVGVYDGSNVALYIDGESLADASTNLSIEGGCTFVIGASHCGDLGFFNGYVSEVAVYDSALDELCIKHHYALGSKGP